jgi:hypothetical protein
LHLSSSAACVLHLLTVNNIPESKWDNLQHNSRQWTVPWR